MNLILASSSPFRKKLLEQVGLTFSCEPPQVDERDVEKDFQGALAKLPLFLAEKKDFCIKAKQRKAQTHHSNAFINLSCPTTCDQLKT